MGKEGEVSRDTVVHVLRANEVGVSIQINGCLDMYVLAKGGIIEARRIPNPVTRPHAPLLPTEVRGSNNIISTIPS